MKKTLILAALLMMAVQSGFAVFPENEENQVRRRHAGTKVYSSVPTESLKVVEAKPLKTLQNKQEEKLFSPLGKGWTYFKSGDYRNASLLLSGSPSDPKVQYLFGRMYEEGFGVGTPKDLREAAIRKYIMALINKRSDILLQKKAEAGLKRMIEAAEMALDQEK